MTERERSHWAWGWADKFPDADERRNLGHMVTSMLGFDDLEPRDPVPLSGVEVGAPDLQPPDDIPFCTSEPEGRIRHCYGRAYPDVVRGFYGEFDNAPDVVAHPGTEEELMQVLEWADAVNVAVIPYGGGTSVVGGVEAAFETDHAGVVSLDLGGLDRVLEIDDVSRAAKIQAGIRGPVLEDALRPRGLTLRHFPQSFEFSTLGGWLATRAGGHYATVWTHIDEFVESMRVVAPSGVVQTRRLPSSGAGPDPNRLMLGSEGILGIITEAWMRLQHRPRFRSKGSFLFDDYSTAVTATRDLAQSGLNPANCRLLDKREAMMNQVVFDGSHVLIVGFESARCETRPLMEQAEEICLSHGARCPDGVRHRDSQSDEDDRGGAAGSWRDAFFEGPYLQGSLVSLGVIADTFETACTWRDFEDFHAGVVERVRGAMKEVCGAGFLTCRFTHVYPDGPAPYYTFVAPAMCGSELDQWREIKAAASEAIVSLGGTITHHHAVGRTHLPWYERERSETFAEMLRAAKGTVDPNGILNPGVLV